MTPPQLSVRTLPRPLSAALMLLAAAALAASSAAQTPPPQPPPGQPPPAQPPPGQPPGGGPGQPPAGPPAPPPRRRAPRPVYALLAPAVAAPGQTVIVRGRNFPRRRRVVVSLAGREVARTATNSIGNFATGFLVAADWPRGEVSIVSRAGGRQVIGKLRITSRPVRPYTLMQASTGATLYISKTGGPPGTRFRLEARGLPGKEDVTLSLSNRVIVRGRASPNGRFVRYLRIPFIEEGRREFRLNAGRLEMASFIDVYPSARNRLAPGRVSLAAAGDIACQPGQPRTFRTCRYADTARLLGRLNPTAIATLGDFQYFVGSVTTAAGAFDGTWGLYKSRIRPTVGDHEYQLPGAYGYFTYFGPNAGPPNGWYSYELGPWHVVVLNSECPRYVSCAPDSPQIQWLRSNLASHPRHCTLAYMSEVRFTSAGRFINAHLQHIWQALYDHGVDVVLGADAHVYERFAPQDVFGGHDPYRGIRQFVVGTGGKDLGRFVRSAPFSEKRFRSFGVLALRLLPGSYQWRFVPIPGYNQRDAGTGACH